MKLKQNDPILISDLNKNNGLFMRNGSQYYLEGLLVGLNMINEMYSSTSSHPYNIGDCVLAKLNLITKKQIRENIKPINP